MIIEGKNDYIITIKGNQPNLLKVATELAESSMAIDTNSLDENLHGRKTTRQVKVYPIPPESLPDWVGAKSVIDISENYQSLAVTSL